MSGVLLALVVLGCVIFAVVGAAWLERWAGGLRERGAEVEGEARTFAAGRDQDACIVEGIRRTGACVESVIACQAMASVFLSTCLESATPVPGLCDAVPPESEIMRSVAWRIETCAARGHPDDQACSQLLAAVQRHCRTAAARTP